MKKKNNDVKKKTTPKKEIKKSVPNKSEKIIDNEITKNKTVKKATKKKNKNTKVKEKENEIKMRFESGENLIDLSVEYKIDYQVLKNISSKKKWEKGKLADLISIQQMIDTVHSNAALRTKTLDQYRDITNKLREHLSTAGTPSIKAQEEALANRTKAIKDLFSLDKELHHVHTDLEALELKKLMTELERLKLQLAAEETEENTKGQPKQLD